MQISTGFYKYPPNNNKITVAEQQQTKAVSFSGLTSVFKKKAFAAPADLSLMVNQFPNSFVGTLPKVWIEAIPKKQRVDVIKQIQQGFSLTVQELQKPNVTLEKNIRDFISKNEHLIKSYTPIEEKIELLNEYIFQTQQKIIPNDVIENAQQILKETLTNSGVCKKLELEYLDSGEFGDVYKLKSDNNEFALKIFKKFHTDTSENVFEKMLYENDVEDFREEMSLHGHLIEPNRSLFWQKNVKEHQNTRMHFSDLKNGGTLSDFVSDNAKPPKKIVDEKYVGLEHTDLGNGNNTINGWVIDGGGQKIANRTITTNANARKVYLKIGTTPVDKRADLWNKIFETKKANRHDIEMGLINSLEFMDIQTLGKLNIPSSKIDKWLQSPSLSYSVKNKLVNKKLFF